MGAYKQLLTSDIIVTPFEVHKDFTFTGGGSLVDPSVGIDRLLGQNIIGSLFNLNSDPTTGNLGTQYQRLVYNSVKELYYSNYLSSSYGDQVNLPILIPGRDTEGDRFVGSIFNPQYYNYPQTTLSYPKFFPTFPNAYVGVISIPARLFGDYIKPGSFTFKEGISNVLTDDGNGNIYWSNEIIGNIFYPHGIIALTTQNPNIFTPFIYSSNITCSFQSSYTIHETQYKCTIRENEYNFTLNPSTISGSTEGTLYGFVTESYFSPYITTVGLYDEQQNLLAVGKLSQPLPSSPTTDTTILINIDR